jgi:signal transduction histidine kinase
LTSIGEFVKGTAFRMATLSAALATVFIVLIFGGLFFISRGELRRSLQTHVAEVQTTLLDVGRSEGLDALTTLIGNRARIKNSEEEDIFLLTDRSGHWLAGNIRKLNRFDGWQSIAWKDLSFVDAWPQSHPTDAIIGRWASLPNGYLFVGDGNRQIRASEQLLLKALTVGVVGTVLAALAAGAVVGWRIQRRFVRIDDVLNQVAVGNFRRRIPIPNSNHDIDRVALLINQAIARLEALLGNLRNVSTDIAHDLRSPLNRLRHKIEIMSEESEENASVLESMLGEIDSITATFDALLRVAEVEAGEHKRFFAELDLGHVLINVVDALEAVAEEKKQRILTDLAPNEVFVSGDRQLLSQLFMNLIENSIQHCAAGATIQVALRVASGVAVVEIRDNGPGIGYEERQNVFKRYYRLDSNRSSPGSGLGLSLAAAIATLHGTTIELEDSSPGVFIHVTFTAVSRQSVTA